MQLRLLQPPQDHYERPIGDVETLFIVVAAAQELDSKLVVFCQNLDVMSSIEQFVCHSREPSPITVVLQSAAEHVSEHIAPNIYADWEHRQIRQAEVSHILNLIQLVTVMRR